MPIQEEDNVQFSSSCHTGITHYNRTTFASLSEKAHTLLKHDILAAVLEPGERLKLDAISRRYDIGVVPIREALSRLSSEGFVQRQSQREFEQVLI